MKSAFLAVLAVSAWLGAGCLSNDVRQVYPGSPLPANETCTLLVPAMLDVRAIDGVPTDWSLRLKKGKMQELSLLPGNHRLLIRYYDPTADESRQEVYEADRLEVSVSASPKSVHELKYETWAHNAELRRAKEKVRVWVVEVAPGVAEAACAATTAAPAATAGTVGSGPADAPAAGGARVDTLKAGWNTLAPAEREAFLKWLLTQPH